MVLKDRQRRKRMPAPADRRYGPRSGNSYRPGVRTRLILQYIKHARQKKEARQNGGELPPAGQTVKSSSRHPASFYALSDRRLRLLFQSLPEPGIGFLPGRRRRDNPIAMIPDGAELLKSFPVTLIGGQPPLDAFAAVSSNSRIRDRRIQTNRLSARYSPATALSSPRPGRKPTVRPPRQPMHPSI
jgi:hypothetical protein